MVKQGDIVLGNLNPRKGHEQKGFRPLLVLSNDIVAKYTNVVIVAPISSTKRKLPLYKDLEQGLQTKGTVLLDQLVTVDYKARSLKTVESVSNEFLDECLDVAQRIFTR